ncbi:MAG: outer membrane beta-barrel protein [Luteibaculaceae bacterium]
MQTIKNVFLASLFTLVLSISAQAQYKGDFVLGAGISYGFDIEEVGLNLSGLYYLSEKMRVGADFIYWLPDNPPGVSTTFFEINTNFHYIFYNENSLSFYGIGSLGVHYAQASVDFLGTEINTSNTETAFGLGAGVEYELGTIRLFAEPRYFFAGFEQLAVSIGTRFSF